MIHEVLFCHLQATPCSGFCMLTWSVLFSHILNSSCHRLGIFMVHENFHNISDLYVLPFGLLLIYCVHCSFLHFFMAQNSLFYFVASLGGFCVLWVSTLLAQANTCSLVISFFFLIAVSSLIISSIISTSFMPFMNFLLIFCLTCIYLFLFWGRPSILHYFHSAPSWIHSIVITILLHYVGV